MRQYSEKGRGDRTNGRSISPPGCSFIEKEERKLTVLNDHRTPLACGMTQSYKKKCRPISQHLDPRTHYCDMPCHA